MKMFVKSVSCFLIIVVSWTITVVCKPTCESSCENGYCEQPEVCTCNTGYTKRFNTCVPVCEKPCINSTCIAPNRCLCNPGFHIEGDICVPNYTNPCGNGMSTVKGTCFCFANYRNNPLRQNGLEPGRVCQPSCKDCSGINCYDCVKIQTFSRRNEDTTTTTKNPLTTISTFTYYYKHDTDYTATTTNNPFITKKTYQYHNEDATKSTTTTPYFERSSSSVERVFDNANNNISSADMIQKSWMQEHGMYIWIPILLITSTVLIVLLVWLGAPMAVINFYKGVTNRRSYNVQGAFRKQNGGNSRPFENLCLFLPDEREAHSKQTN